MVAEGLTKENLSSLTAGRIALIRVPEFLPPSWCEKLTGRFLAAKSQVFKRRDYSDVRTLELGGMIAAHLDNRAEYFSKVKENSSKLRRFYAGGEDPYLKLRDAIAAASGWKSRTAEEKGQPYLSDFIWGFPPGSTIPLHHDDSKDRLGLFYEQFSIIWSWNVFLSVSEEGGCFSVFRRTYKSEDEKKRVGLYGYSQSVVKGAQEASCRPRVGDLVLFNGANYHQADQLKGAGHRIASHSFIGVDPKRKIFSFWI